MKRPTVCAIALALIASSAVAGELVILQPMGSDAV